MTDLIVRVREPATSDGDEAIHFDSETGLLSRAGSPVGGVSPVYQATATLIDGQIKTLHTAPVEIVPQPGIGKMVVVVRAILRLHLPTTGYGWTDPEGSAPFLYLATPAQASTAIVNSALDGFFSVGDPNDKLITLQGSIGPGSGSQPIVGLQFQASNVNTPLTLKLDTAFDHSVGDPVNTLRVTALYMIVDV